MNAKERKDTLRCAGGFIAWMIGPGFATGQEILQFYSSCGWWSFGVLALTLAGFLFLGITLLGRGFDHKEKPDFAHFRFYCGGPVGKIYGVVIPVTLVLLISVLISAAGATLEQYFGIDRYFGSCLMAALILAAYLIGFEKMVKLISSIGPVIIAFVIFVGCFTVFRDAERLPQIGETSAVLADAQAAPHWILSALLYLSLNFFCGSTYYTELGRSAVSRRSAVTGAVLGTAALLVTMLLMNVSILLHAEEIVSLSVPTLFLAEQISGIFGAVFSVVLVCGMFSSCSTMMWSFCSRFFRRNRKKNAWFSTGAVLFCTLLGFFPFGDLVSVVYPLIGYAGLYFIGCAVYQGLKKT